MLFSLTKNIFKYKSIPSYVTLRLEIFQTEVKVFAAFMLDFAHESGQYGPLNIFALVKVLFPQNHREFYLLGFCHFFVLKDVTVELVVKSEVCFRKHMRLF